MRDNLSTLLSPERLEKLRRNGAIVFDVDDTLLARRGKFSENDQIFSESPAALSVPRLLNAGVRVCVITGHGWAQLEKRFVAPLDEEISNLFPEKRDEILKRFFVYANRGATKIIRENDDYIEETVYGGEFSFDETDLVRLREILERLKESSIEDFAKRKEWHLENFPEFNFEELPPEILEREKVVLGLRPIFSEAHCEKNAVESPRRRLFLLGCEMIKNAGLDEKYEIAESGKSTLEITRREVSKKAAFRDLISGITKEKGISPETVEESSIYVGDEFAPGGNDYIISQSFPRCLCLSVASDRQENVISLRDFFHLEGIPAASALAARIIKFLT